MARVQAGVPVTAVVDGLHRSRRWVSTWLARAHSRGGGWAADRSHRPAQFVQATSPEVVEAVRLVRLFLSNQGLLYGAQNIRWELAELGLAPLPAVRIINRILAHEDLTHRRTGRYVSKGTRSPALVPSATNQVHQLDYVGPCYLRGAVRLWSPNTVDVATARCA